MFVFSKRPAASISPSIFSCIHGNRLPEPGLERVRESPDGRRDLRAGRSRAGRAGALDSVFIRHEVRFSALCAPKRTGRFRPQAPVPLSAHSAIRGARHGSQEPTLVEVPACRGMAAMVATAGGRRRLDARDPSGPEPRGRSPIEERSLTGGSGSRNCTQLRRPVYAASKLAGRAISAAGRGGGSSSSSDGTRRLGLALS
jgi:hypothetical protein